MEKKTNHLRELPFIAQIGLLMGPFLSMLDSNIVNVALPDIASSIDASMNVVQWIVSGYLLAISAFIAASGFLAKRFGNYRVYIFSMIGFTLGSLLCAVAPNISFLIAARVIQGMFGSSLVPIAISMLVGSDGDRDKEFPIYMGIILFLSPALAPTIGGLLIHFFNWQSIFWVNVPIGILGCLAVMKLPESHRIKGDSKQKFDALGFLLFSAGLTLITYGVSKGPEDGWFAGSVWPLWGSGLASFVLYYFWSRRCRFPIISLKILKEENALLSLILCVIASVAMYSILIMVPVFMENIMQTSPVTTGLVLLPQGIVTGLGTYLGNKLPKRFGVKVSVIAGMELLVSGTLLLQVMDAQTSNIAIAALLLLRGFAVGLVIQPLLTRLLGGLAPVEQTNVTTLFTSAQRLGGASGVALITTFLQARVTANTQNVLAQLGISPDSAASGAGGAVPPQIQAQLTNAMVKGFHETVWLITAFSALGILMALLLKRKKKKTAEE